MLNEYNPFIFSLFLEQGNTASEIDLRITGNFLGAVRFLDGPSLQILDDLVTNSKLRSKKLDTLLEIEIAIAAKEQALSYLKTKRTHTSAKFKKVESHWSKFA